MKRVITMPELRGIEWPNVPVWRRGYNTSTVALLIAENDKKGTPCLGV
jgi:hypothetical protein